MSSEKVCVELLINNRLTVATAESCTGGLVASALVSVEGSSQCFSEGCVTYSPQAKMSRLGVREESIEKYTVVSAEVAQEMARGIRQNLNADIGISTTGYAGPGGGDTVNPVGTVYIGYSDKTGECCYKLRFDGSRNEIRKKAADAALKILERKLKKHYSCDI